MRTPLCCRRASIQGKCSKHRPVLTSTLNLKAATCESAAAGLVAGPARASQGQSPPPKRRQNFHCHGLQDNKQQYPAHAKVISHLSAVLEELPDVPLYVNLHDMCKTIKATAPKAETFRSAIINGGGRSTAMQSLVA